MSAVSGDSKNPTDEIILIDVRFPIEFKGGHLESCINIPLLSLGGKLDSFDADTIYVVVCDGGRRSEVAAHILSQQGLSAYIFKSDTPPTWFEGWLSLNSLKKAYKLLERSACITLPS